RALGHPGVGLFHVQQQALVGTGSHRIVVTQTLDVAAITTAALIGHHDVIERTALGAATSQTNSNHNLETPICRGYGTARACVHRERGILTEMPEKGRGGT